MIVKELRVIGFVALVYAYAVLSPEASAPGNEAFSSVDLSPLPAYEASSSVKLSPLPRAEPVPTLTVNALKPIRPFSREMLGQAFVNWEHSWGRPFVGDVPYLADAMKGAGVGVIRYAGGLWANDVGFDRTPQRRPYESWDHNGMTYWFHYGTDELASLKAFADATGAEVMIQVNISNNDPEMWADMVRYCNIEKGYDFRYWELGNEFDVAADKGVSPDEYSRRVKLYIDAMKAVDPSIRIIVGVPGNAHDAPRLGWSDSVTALSEYLIKSAKAVSSEGRIADDVSYHWYQGCNAYDVADLMRWTWQGLAESSWRNSYATIWSRIAPERVKNEIIAADSSMRQGITELNFDACDYENHFNGNHLGAVWASDILGRLAYYGLDFATWYEGYGTQGYALVYPDNADNPTRLYARPTYYAFFMYDRYFGDQLVESLPHNDGDLSVWASTDSREPSKLKLRITNLSAVPVATAVHLVGFIASTGEVYVLESTDPTDASPSSNTAAAPTTINGKKLDVMDLAVSASAIQPMLITVDGDTFTHTFPAYSTTAIVLNAR